MKRWFLLLGSFIAAEMLGGNAPPTVSGILWREPKPATMAHWTCGPGGCEQAPVPPFRFKSEDFVGSSPKVNIEDARGRSWSIKFGTEVIPECFGSRFVSALGYLAEPTYFVASGKVDEIVHLRRANRFIHADGSFTNGRFEVRDTPNFEFVKNMAWEWDQSPFLGTREFAGLKILMMLLSNWDAKDTRDSDSNVGVFRVKEAGAEFLYHGVFKWGACLGHWGGALHRDQSDVVGYTEDTPKFIKGVHGDTIEWGFRGKHANDLTSGITLKDARWLLIYLDRIKPDEIRTGLRSSGATDRQAECWTKAIEDRIQQLRNVAGHASAGN